MVIFEIKIDRQENEKEKELLYLASGGGMGDH